MKKFLLTSGLALAGVVSAQFSSGTVNLGATGMTVKLDTTPTGATITLTGSETSYLGIGFGSNGMATGSDGFIYNSSANRDYTFNGIGATPSADASQDWTEVSNTTSGGIRTVVATRSLAGGAGDMTIPNAAGAISIYFAKGPGTALSSGYHGGANRGYATLNMAGALSINEVSAENKRFMLYPNPAKEIVNIKNGDKIRSIDIYDSAGRKVKSAKSDSGSIRVSDLKPGSYYFEIVLKDGNLLYEKIIKE